MSSDASSNTQDVSGKPFKVLHGPVGKQILERPQLRFDLNCTVQSLFLTHLNSDGIAVGFLPLCSIPFDAPIDNLWRLARQTIATKSMMSQTIVV
jgi:hypothetical protein